MSWAKVGAKCVCVDDAIRPPPNRMVEFIGGLDGLTEGRIYTIREIYIDPYSDEVQVCLNEIWRPTHPDENFGRESGYSIDRFRPLITRTQEQDVALFRHNLNSAPQGVEA